MDFDIKQSAYYSLEAEGKQVLEVVANRYIGANPPLPYINRAFSTSGIMQNSEGMYLLDFTEKYASSPNGCYAYAMALVWSDEERSIDGVMKPLGPITLYHNNHKLYRSSVIEELKQDGAVTIPLLFAKGWNTLLIEARKTPAGFGCHFGAEEGKVRILQVLSPFNNRTGQAGWIFSEPSTQSIYGDQIRRFPDWTRDESCTDLAWHPRTSWTEQEKLLPNMERIFGYQQNAAAYARATLNIPAGTSELTMKLQTYGAACVWLDEQLIFSTEEAGIYNQAITLNSSKRSPQLKVWNASGEQHWGFELGFESSVGAGLELNVDTDLLSTVGAYLELNVDAGLESNVETGLETEAGAFSPKLQLVSVGSAMPIHGYTGSWMFAGPLTSDMPSLQAQPFARHALLEQQNKKLYWQLDAPDFVVRPYYENAMLSNKWTVGSMSNFARWDYPLGVTMYGLLRSGKLLGREDMIQYTLAHITSCTDWYEYSLWDCEQYGFPSINHQLVLIKMLDNCGSFGSAMLEAYSITQDPCFARIAEVIADFILNKLERKDDGAFYRICEGEYSANTMWADDLYMSAPFLIRYASLFNKPEALNEAAKQFLLYKNYLFMEDQGLMSHVYDFKYGRATKVPWGRGNGWVLFSLSELLERLPASHELYNQLLHFYKQFVAGIVSFQSDSGLWHQVINEPGSYEEASCTAMFVYGIARGIRFGWLDQQAHCHAPSPVHYQAYYGAIVQRGWEGLTKQAIDRQGHVFGVCSGSRYSFAPDYYMYNLRTVVNDNHGIGIMMLAGVEIEQLHAFFNQQSVKNPETV